MSARAYLIDRFRGDAATLRDRTAALAGGAALPGPDLSTSQQMADACTIVAELLDAVPMAEDTDHEISALLALIPTLESRARTVSHPPVRSVYAGAVTRIREVQAAHARRDDAP